MGTGTGGRTETRAVAEMGTGTRIGANSYRCDVENGGDLDEKRRKRRQERVGPVPANPDNVENENEAGGETQGTQGSSKDHTLSPLFRRFRNKYH